jgi:hypothetical protein
MFGDPPDPPPDNPDQLTGELSRDHPVSNPQDERPARFCNLQALQATGHHRRDRGYGNE